MKVGILVASLEPYGAEKALLRVAQGLHNAGKDVVIILLDFPSANAVEGIPVIPLLTGRRLSEFQKIFYAPIQYLRLRRVLKKEKIDVLISFMERANIINLGLIANVKRIISIRTFLSVSLRESPKINRLTARFFYKNFIHRASKVVFNSNVSARDTSDMFPVEPDKIAVVRNAYEIDTILEQAKEPLEPVHSSLFSGKTILHVGRFTKDKGQWYLIRAFKKVLESVPDVNLVFLGDGELRPYMEGLIRDMNLQEKVHLLGIQNNPYKFMARATVLGFTSLWEGFPNSLSEAIINNMAVVATDCLSGPRELLAPETDVFTVAKEIEQARYGLLIPPFDGNFKNAHDPYSREEEFLVEGLVRLLTDDQLRENYQKIGLIRMQPFHRDNVTQQWIKVLEEALK